MVKEMLMVKIIMPSMLMQTRTWRRTATPTSRRRFARRLSIVKAEVSLYPNIPNKELKALLKDYVKDIFLTASLLQQTRTTIWKEVFGDADTNVMYVPALQRLLQALG
jgi:hypothetical protein